MLDIDKIRELVDMMIANDLIEISLRDGDMEVNLRRPGGDVGEVMPVVAAQPAASLPAANAPAGVSSPVEEPATEDEIKTVEIKSPMVGTYYSSSEPGAPPFIEVGSNLTADTVVCIVEAMKVFNEIKAECTGTIVKIVVGNGDPVEFGQPLFMVRPV